MQQDKKLMPDESIIDHPAFYDFYDEWNCGTVEEVQKQFDFIWDNYSNEHWGNEAIKEKVRNWVLFQFGPGDEI